MIVATQRSTCSTLTCEYGKYVFLYVYYLCELLALDSLFLYSLSTYCAQCDCIMLFKVGLYQIFYLVRVVGQIVYLYSAE